MSASVVIDGKTVVFCHGCEKPSMCTQQDSLPDNGWVFPYGIFGYYGGFTDNIDALLGLGDAENEHWILCHDCIVKILTVLPLLGESLPKGQHPCETAKPCCKWAWKRLADKTVVPDELGNWVEMTSDDALS